jgi:dsDNA-specific endonuclease/ATPase MutS2
MLIIPARDVHDLSGTKHAPQDFALCYDNCEYLMSADNEPLPIPITDVFDLHAVHPKEVEAAVEAYLEEAGRLGFKHLRIVHGRGIGVQRQIVRSVLARTPFVVSFSDAPPEAGGWGATVVNLR